MLTFFSMMFLSCESSVVVEKQVDLSKYQKALVLAQKEHKTIMLKLTSVDCHFCKKMDREVMKSREVLAFLKRSFILVEIDVKKEKLPLGLKYKVTPTFFFINKNEKIISKIQGSWNKKDFIDLLEMVLKKVEGEER